MNVQRSAQPRNRRSLSVAGFTLTAAAAFGAGFFVSARTAREPAPVISLALASTGIIPPASTLHDALEQLPSGAEREIEAGLIAAPRVSYRALSGVWCRRFELRAASGRTDAVACRGADAWRIAAFATGPKDSGGANGTSGDSNIIDAAVAATIDGDALDTQEEIEVVVGGWQPDLL